MKDSSKTIENARLLKAERRHLSLLYEISRELNSSLDPDEILDRAISLTCQALGGTVGLCISFSGNRKSADCPFDLRQTQRDGFGVE